MSQVGEAFARALRAMLISKGLTVSKAAQRMHVSRQTFHAYLNGKLPRQKRLNKIMSDYDLTLGLNEQSFDKTAFVKEGTRASPEWRQLTLFETLDSISSQNLQVSVKRTGRVFRVHVAIDIPA
jgi:transcriptional regulator with XRE-family HTH domain